MPLTALRHRRRSDFAWGLAILGIWMVTLDFPNVIAADDLDLSWGQALGHFVSHSSQAGVDYIFTYGPLGYFSTENYDASLFSYAFWWNIIIALVFALAVVRLARFSANRFVALLFIAVVVAVDFPTPGNKEDFLRTLMLAMALPLLRPRRVSQAMLVFSVLVIAVVAQVKFTYAVLAFLGICCCELRYRLESPRSIFTPFTLFVPGFCLTWMLAGQRLWNIPAYVRASVEISNGYLAAMGSSNPDPFHIITIAAVLLCLLVVAAVIYCVSARISPRSLSIAFLLLVNAWLAWKHAVTRADSGHLIIFLGMIAILFLLLPVMLPTAIENRWSRFRVALVAVALLLCGYGSCRLIAVDGIPWSLASVKSNLDVIWSPSQYRKKMDTDRADLARQFNLPKIKAIVGAHSTDIISFEQGVLLLNQLNYQPRPIFQSYQVNNHFLIHTNGRYFASARAPDYVIFKGEPIDNRLPSIEDSESLLVLADRYCPVAMERGFTLLKRLDDQTMHHSAPTRPAFRGNIRWNSPLDLPDPAGGYETLSLKFKPSLRGSILTLLYKEAEVYAVLRLTSGQTVSFRIVPVMAEDEFLINPLLLENILPLYLPATGPRIASILFTTKDPGFFDDQIGFELKTYRRAIDPVETDRLLRLMVHAAESH
jgi:hypothetical protein